MDKLVEIKLARKGYPNTKQTGFIFINFCLCMAYASSFLARLQF